MNARRHVLQGVIASCGFASGDRVVVGHWWRSPVGAFTDVMWATPDATRILFAPDDTVARFVTDVYAFDQVEIAPFELVGPGASGRPRRIHVSVGDRTIMLQAGRCIPVFGRRPAWFTRWIELPVARRVMAVHPYGHSPTGVDEWYQARQVARLSCATASIGGVDLGAVAPIDPPVGVGFSEPPSWPSWVELRTVLADPSGRLDELIAELGGQDLLE